MSAEKELRRLQQQLQDYQQENQNLQHEVKVVTVLRLCSRGFYWNHFISVDICVKGT